MYSRAQAALLSDIPEWRLRYWCDNEIYVVPKSVFGNMVYTDLDIKKLRRMKDLIAAGFTPLAASNQVVGMTTV